MELHARLNQFRLASRELFNQYFRIAEPDKNAEASVLQERFCEVESLLFQKLVVEPTGIPSIPYGVLNPGICIELMRGDFAPIMLNREIDSGYWDHSLRVVTRDAKLGFISFFDWDHLDFRDHGYVRVQVLNWPSEAEVLGKHALIETHYVRFRQG